MKKQLNVDQIQSELRGGSAFFPGYKGAAASPTPPPPETTPAPERASGQGRGTLRASTPERSFARTPERVAGKRIITRNSFEIYEDQMDSLRRLSFQEKMNGKLGSMSAMVREAIDTYLKEHLSEK